MVTNSSPFYVDEAKPWFSAEAGWPADVSKNLDFPEITLYELLSESVKQNRDKPILWCLNTFITYGKFLEHADSCAAGLNGLGVNKGAVVACAMPSCFQYAIAFYACGKLGAIVTGVNPISKPAEIEHQLKSTGARTLIVLNAIYEPLFAPLRGKHDFNRIVAIGTLDLVDMPPEQKEMAIKAGKIPTGRVPETTIQFLDLLKSDPSGANVETSPEDIATYIMTGGTTGVPKVAILSHFNCVSSAVSVAAWLWPSPGACVIGILPLFHVFGMACVHTVVRNGGYLLLFPKPPSVEELLQTVCAVGVDGNTFYPGAEVLFQQLADFPDLDKYPIAAKVNKCMSSAGPLHKFVKDRFEERLPGVALREGYGLSESSAGIAIGPYDNEFVSGSIGLPLPGVDWKIVDMETGNADLAPGESGELVVSGPMIMRGYLNNLKETQETLRVKDGKVWLYTGDIGYMDDKGRVFLNDRKKLLIKVKGYSVFPTEVEELLGQHEAIHESAVAGLPDLDTGEAIKAWIVLKPDWKGRISEAQLQIWCKANMTHYKVPKHIEFVDVIPKTMVGKVMRRELQEADPLYTARRQT